MDLENKEEMTVEETTVETVEDASARSCRRKTGTLSKTWTR